MIVQNHKPVIFLAFANVRDGSVTYLRNLPEELRRVRAALERARVAGLCDIVERTNATTNEILEVFQHPEYRNRIAIFHYGGHANGFQLLLESPEGKARPAYASGFAAFLGQQRGLQLVFLNGCSTQQQAQGLLEVNVKTVIATSQDIVDDIAVELAVRFYSGLVSANIHTAFNEATASIRTEIGDDWLNYYHGVRSEEFHWPWHLYLNAGFEGCEQWNLQHAARNPLFGLPEAPLGDLPPKPYRHLNWFTRKHAEIFFGRGRQIRDLYDLVMAADSAPIILLYGQSGVGKSSLLEAGLMPRLESSHAIQYHRRQQESGLLGSVLEALGATEKMTIAQAWLTLENAHQKPAIVILDQVEEVYTRPNPDLPDELQKFLEALALAFVDSVKRPRGKLILGFRKEWLAEMEKRLSDNELFHTKIFLERLDRDGIIEAITGPARVARLQQHYGLRITDGLAEIIADDLLEDRDSPIAPTLQILLNKMWDEAVQQNRSHPYCSHDLYNNLKKRGILLQDFLNQQLNALRDWQLEVVDFGLALNVLAFHTTPLGSAEQRTAEQLAQEYRHRQDVLPALVQKCKDLYLLVDPAADQPEAALATATRLTHDTLAPLIRKQFDESDKPGQRAHRILENRSVEWREDQQGTPLDERDLAVVEQGEKGMRAWKSDEQRLIEVSRKLKAQRQRNRKIWWGVGVAAILAILLSAGVAWWQSGEAKKQARESKSRQLAAQALTHLDDQLDLALLLSLEAYRTDSAFEARSSLLTALQYNPHLTNFLHGHTNGIVSVAFSPDGKILASGGWDSDIIIWDVITKRPLCQPLTGHTDAVMSLAFSPDSKTLVSGSRDKTIILWDVTTQQPLGQPLTGHRGEVTNLGFSPDGKFLASGGSDSTVILWDFTNRLQFGQPLRDHQSMVKCVAFSPDGKILVSSSNKITLWNVLTRQPCHLPIPDNQDKFSRVIFSPDGETLVLVDSSFNIHLWDPTTQKKIGQPFIGHWGSIWSMAFNSHYNILASGSADGSIILWDASTRRPFNKLLTKKRSGGSLAFSPDGRTLAFGDDYGNIILWNVINSGRQLNRPLIGDSSGSVSSMVFSPDGRTLAASHNDSVIILWDIQTRQQIGQPLIGHHNEVKSLAFSPNSNILFSASKDQTINLWDVATHQQLGQTITVPIDHSIGSIAISPDCKILASSSSDGTIVLWDINTRRQVGQPLSGYGDKMRSMTSLSFSPDGKILADIYGGTIILWDITTRLRLGQIFSGQHQVTSMAFSPDGKILASTNGEIIILWDFATRQLIGSLDTRDVTWVASLAFNPDGKSLASGGSYNGIMLWDVNLKSWQTRTCNRVNRNLTIDEWRRYVHDDVFSYRCTCNGLPIHPSFIEYGKDLARNGDVDGAIKIFERAKELDSNLDLNPKTEAQELAAVGLVAHGERLTRQGKIKEAIDAYEKAQKLDPMLTLSASNWNNLCWFGSLWGHSAEVMDACEKAVALNSVNGGIRDSRGLAKALTGDVQGAIEDFQAFIEWTKDEQGKKQRQRWIDSLRVGKNPFTPAVLKKLHEQ